MTWTYYYECLQLITAIFVLPMISLFVFITDCIVIVTLQCSLIDTHLCTEVLTSIYLTRRLAVPSFVFSPLDHRCDLIIVFI